MMAALRILAVAAILSSSGPPSPRAETARPARPKFLSIVSFCKVHGTVDYPPEKGFGDPENENLPPLLSQTDANRWRCLDGKVLVCADSADGDQCARKADDRHPAIVAEVCRDGHEGEEVPSMRGIPIVTTGFAVTAELSSCGAIRSTGAAFSSRPGRPSS